MQILMVMYTIEEKRFDTVQITRYFIVRCKAYINSNEYNASASRIIMVVELSIKLWQ